MSYLHYPNRSHNTIEFDHLLVISARISLEIYFIISICIEVNVIKNIIVHQRLSSLILVYRDIKNIINVSINHRKNIYFICCFQILPNITWQYTIERLWYCLHKGLNYLPYDGNITANSLPTWRCTRSMDFFNPSITWNFILFKYIHLNENWSTVAITYFIPNTSV